MHRGHRGKFQPKNPTKYVGEVNNITWRSTWELKVMNWMDLEESVINWSSEEISIIYVSPIDNRSHRYFPDFRMKVKDRDGMQKTYLIEVKPAIQTVPPKVRSKVTAKYITEVKTWGVNSAKWEAAENFCKDRDWQFVKITENDLFPGMKR